MRKWAAGNRERKKMLFDEFFLQLGGEMRLDGKRRVTDKNIFLFYFLFFNLL